MARVNGVRMDYTKYATCKRNAKKEFLDTMEWTSSSEVEIIEVLEIVTK